MGHGEGEGGEVGSEPRNHVQLEILFSFAHVLILLLLGLWGRSTWGNRHLLFVRVRRPRLLLIDLLQSAIFTSVICITEVLVNNDVVVPCRFQHIMALLFFLTNPAVVIWRGIQLWNGFAAHETRDLKELYKIRSATATAKIVPALLGLTAVLIAASGAQLCFSDMCIAQCYYGSQHLLLLPVVAITNIQSYVTWRMLRKTHKVERVGLLSELERFAAFSAPLVLLGFLFTILVDLHLMSARQGQTLSGFCWLLAILVKFVVIHVSPSFQFGYAPSCNTYARVIPVGDGGSAAGLETSPPEGTGAFSQRNRDYDLVTKEGIVEALQRARYRQGSLASAALVSGMRGEGEDGNSRASVSNWRSPSIQLTGRRSSVQPSATPRRSSVLLSPQDGSGKLPSGVSGPEQDDRTFSIWEMSMDQVMASEIDVLPDFLAFCQSLLCDHMLLFLLALRPYHQREGELQPRVLPEEKLRAVYTTYIKTGAARTVPLPTNLAKAIRQYCQPMAGDNHLQGMRLKPITEESLKTTSSLKDSQSLDRSSTLRETLHKTKEIALSSDPVSTIGMLMELAYLEIEALLAEEALPMFKAYMQESELEAIQPQKRRRSSIFSGLSMGAIGGHKRPTASVLPLTQSSPHAMAAPGQHNALPTSSSGAASLQPTIVIQQSGTQRASKELSGAAERSAAETKSVAQGGGEPSRRGSAEAGDSLLSLLDDLSDEAAVAPHKNHGTGGLGDSAKPYLDSDDTLARSSNSSGGSDALNGSGGFRQQQQQPLFDSDQELLMLLAGSGGHEGNGAPPAISQSPGREEADVKLPASSSPAPPSSLAKAEGSPEQLLHNGQAGGVPQQQTTAVVVAEGGSAAALSKEEIQRQEEKEAELRLLSMFDELKTGTQQSHCNQEAKGQDEDRKPPQQPTVAVVAEGGSAAVLRKEEIQRQEEKEAELRLLSMFDELESSIRQDHCDQEAKGQMREEPQQQATAIVAGSGSSAAPSRDVLQRQEEKEAELKLLSMFDELEASIRQGHCDQEAEKQHEDGEPPQQQTTAVEPQGGSPAVLSKEALQRQEEKEAELKLLSMLDELEASLRQGPSGQEAKDQHEGAPMVASPSGPEQRSSHKAEAGASALIPAGKNVVQAALVDNPLHQVDQASWAKAGGSFVPEDEATDACGSVEAELSDRVSPTPFVEPGAWERQRSPAKDAIVVTDKHSDEVSTAEQGAAPGRGIEEVAPTSFDQETGDGSQPVDEGNAHHDIHDSAKATPDGDGADGQCKAGPTPRKQSRAEEGAHTQPASGAAERETSKAEEQGVHIVDEERVDEAASAGDGLSREQQQQQAEGMTASAAPQSRLDESERVIQARLPKVIAMSYDDTSSSTGTTSGSSDSQRLTVGQDERLSSSAGLQPVPTAEAAVAGAGSKLGGLPNVNVMAYDEENLSSGDGQASARQDVVEQPTLEAAAHEGLPSAAEAAVVTMPPHDAGRSGRGSMNKEILQDLPSPAEGDMGAISRPMQDNQGSVLNEMSGEAAVQRRASAGRSSWDMEKTEEER